ncbi:MAG TPA: xylan 1,4-beta-xylosidase [Syntrophaceticus sp.]|jgi:hypothetical protein|uniref:DUF6440 domain-containing protein n=1 Tax=Syntrophaceticus schinkii TaxID=499207 RepID=A0A0B7MKW4_9FIRM|nr:DUF6440 family protein [Syntrophaceticus schinkii]MDD4262863.1 DUF6440 family protein [Syntrophaceticus schinkii]CEO88823.1 hypothetical protein SSCH_270014 [Syntrophaceticus schinkii]HHY30313.1 xylan 1,4-beta-xylosidase [Syntrophaceticus sp.]
MEKKEYGFEVKGVRSPTGTYIKIIVDKTTGVNYLFCSVGAAGGLTPLLNSDGSPIITTNGSD